MLEKYQTFVENFEPKTDHGTRLFKMCKFSFKIKILAQKNTKVKELFTRFRFFNLSPTYKLGTQSNTD